MAGVDEQHWVALETAGDSTFGVVAAMTAADGCALDELTVQPERDFRKIEEHRGTASPQGWIRGKLRGTWGARGPLKTRAAGTEPDFGAFAEAATLKAPAVVGGTSVTYALEARVPKSLRMLVHQDDGADGTEPMTQWLYGAWVEQFGFKQEENADPKWEASGGFAHMGWVHGAPQTDTTGYAQGSTQITLEATDKFKVGPGAYVAFGSSDNGGSGYEVTDVSADGLTLTISPGIAVGEDIPASNTAVDAHVPGHTIGGTIQGGVEVASTIDSVAVGIIKQNFMLNTGIHGLDGESTTDQVNRIRRGERSYECEFEWYFLDETAGYFGMSLEGVLVPVTLQYGADSAGNRLKIPMSQVRLYANQINRDAQKESRIAGAFFPEQDSVAEDEFTFVLD